MNIFSETHTVISIAVYSALIVMSLLVVVSGVWIIRLMVRHREQQRYVAEQTGRIEEKETEIALHAAAACLLEDALQHHDQERKRLAHELHDGIGNTLLAIRLKLEEAANSKEPDPESLKDGLRMLTHVGKNVQEVAQHLASEK